MPDVKDSDQTGTTNVNHDAGSARNEPVGDVDSNIKLVSAVAYLGILFFVPMLTHPKNEFAMFHANQGLLLLIASAIISFASGFVPLLGWFLILPAGSIFTLVLFIMGVINVLNGHMKRLPLIGGFDIIKPTY